jgi:succinate dehydrogenase / fumarate reductase cytochrome b subunit
MKLDKPLSPHIGIYKWQLTSIMSIAHRFCGIAIIGNFILFNLWLYGLSSGGPVVFEKISEFIAIPYIRICIWLGITTFHYHALNGIRHLLWDHGFCHSIRHVRISGCIVVLLTLCMTVSLYLFWSF